MQRYGLIQASVVALVVEAQAQPVGWVALPNGVGPRWTFDGSEFAAPVDVPAPRHITRLAMRQRFTQAERLTLEIAQIDNPGAGLPARQAAAALRVALDDLSVATWVDLDRADTRASVQGLEAAGLIGSGRALEILDAPVQTHERYAG